MIRPIPFGLTAFLAAPAFALAAPVGAQETMPDYPVITAAVQKDASADTPPMANPRYWLYARVLVGQRELWAGNLAMTPYGRASVHTDITEMDATCPLKNDRFAPRRDTIELAIGRASREGDRLYAVDVRWTHPVTACAQEGTRAIGFKVEVELVGQETRVIEGERGLRVELTRQP
jgi:hypothetical protein